MRKIKLIAGIAAALIAVVFIAAWVLLDANRYHDQVQARLEDALKRKVTLGDMHLRLLPIRFTVDNLAIAEDPGFKSTMPFIQAARLDVRIAFFSLLRGAVQIDSIELSQPGVELIRNEAGVWNFASLAKSESKAPAPTPSPADETTSGAPTAFSLSRLAIQGGRIAITDLQKKQARSVYEPIDLTLTDYAPGQPFSFDVKAHIPGPADSVIQVAGTGGPLPADGPAAMPIQAKITLDRIDVGGLKKFLDSASTVVPSAGGSLSGETRVESKAGKLSASGKLRLEGVRVNTIDIGYPLGLDYEVSSETAKGVIEISKATLQLGPTPFTLTGSIDTNPSPVVFDLRLQAGDASIAEAARLGSAFGIAFSPGAAVAGRLSGDVRARGPADRLALDGMLRGRDLQISGKDVPQPVQVPAIDLTLTPAEVRSNDFEARSGKTVLNGRFAMRNYTSKSPTVDVAVKAPNATLPEIQAIANAYGMTGLQQLNGSGALNFDLRASGPLESVASANVMRSVNGNINLNFETLKLKGVDVAHELASIGGFLKSGVADQGFTDILRLSGRIAVKNGIAETNDLEAKLNEGTLAVVGSSDIADETLNLRGTAVFSKAFSEKAGGTKIGGYLTTALSNEKGEIVIPAIISGTYEKPKFAPDTQAFLQMQRKKLLPGLDNPRAALGGILDAISGKKTTAEPNAATEEKKPTTVKGILGGLLGGKK